MIMVKGQTDIDKFIIGHIIDPSAPNVEFKNVTFDCKTIKDASGYIFVRQKTGEWKRRLVDNGFNADWVCSECGYRVKTDFVSFNYCPNCGAKMGGDTE